MVEECQIRQWVGFYTSRVKLETDWDTLSRDALAAVLEVRKISGAVTVVARDMYSYMYLSRSAVVYRKRVEFALCSL